MPADNVHSTGIEIKVQGTAVAPAVLHALLEAVVDQHTHLPHMFTLRLHDPDLELTNSGPFDLAKEVEISIIDPDGPTVQLIKGEITALEPEFQQGMVTALIVRGYDKSHRLFRETKSQAFLNIKDSDLASQIAGNAGLSTAISATNTVYDHIYQDNQSDLAFLMQRAWRIGYECFVDDGKLYFRKPPTSGEKVTLVWGIDLASFYPVMTLAGQVDEVVVRGWDVDKQQAVVGQAKQGALYPKTGESKDGAKWAQTFGTGKRVVVDIPVANQAEANVLAQARLDEISGLFVEAEGEVVGRPEIRAGKFVEIEGVGSRFSGTYMVTESRHRYDSHGLTTTFAVRGTRTGTLTEQLARQEPLRRWMGVVTAVVTNSDDPNDWGRVKLKYPWMADDAESDWARVIGPGGGPKAGMVMIPDVNDEVLVAFEHGDFNRPFVIGGLWNGQHALPPAPLAAAAGEKPMARVWQSRTGHYVVMHDDDDNKVEMATAAGHVVLLDDKNKKMEITTSGGHKVTLDDQGKKLEIVSGGGHKVTLDDNGRKIIIESGGQLEIKSSTGLKIESGGTMDIKATGSLSLKGAVVKIN
jgi:phage protein D